MIKKIVILLMSVILAFGFIGCNNSSRGDKNNNTLDDTVPNTSPGGVHKEEAKDMGKWIYIGGSTDYIIVTPSGEQSNLMKVAHSELKFFLKEATGTSPIVKEASEVTYTENAKFLVVGTELLDAAGIEIDEQTAKDLGTSGGRIETKGNSVFMYGNTDSGAITAVYQFLKLTLNYDSFGPDYFIIDKTGDIKLYDFDVVESPDFEFRQPSGGMFNRGSNTGKRLGYSWNSEIYMPVNGVTWHNTFEWLDPNVYAKDHPKWYSSDKTQLSFVAQGDEVEYEAMVSEFFRRFVEVINLPANRETPNITITHEDLQTWCDSAATTAEKDKYGTDSAVLIKFCNEISRRLEAYFESEEGKPYKREINILFFAYGRTMEAPVTKTEDGYVPIDGLVCRDNVFALYAPTRMYFDRSLNDPMNLGVKEIMESWSAVSKKLFVWIYQTNFSHYLFPINTFDVKQENYRVMKDLNVSYIHDQTQWNNSSMTAFHELKNWINGKLLWNTELNVQELYDYYFDNYFLAAAPYMQEYFDTLRAHLAFLSSEDIAVGTIYHNIPQEKYFPKKLLESWIKLIDKAYEAIEPLKSSNIEMYEKVKRNITVESIFPRYALVSLYPGQYSASELQSLRLSFREDCFGVGITKLSEWGLDMSTVYTNWGL